jgi:hypothetical protein
VERSCTYVLASVEAGHADDQVGRGLAEVVLPQEPFVGLTWRGAAMMRVKCVRPRRDQWIIVANAARSIGVGLHLQRDQELRERLFERTGRLLAAALLLLLGEVLVPHCLAHQLVVLV